MANDWSGAEQGGVELSSIEPYSYQSKSIPSRNYTFCVSKKRSKIYLKSFSFRKWRFGCKWNITYWRLLFGYKRKYWFWITLQNSILNGGVDEIFENSYRGSRKVYPIHRSAREACSHIFFQSFYWCRVQISSTVIGQFTLCSASLRPAPRQWKHTLNFELRMSKVSYL